MSDNIHYNSQELSKYFSKNRIKWDDLYVSEKNVLNYVNPLETAETLDIGCGCAGLGIALKQKFNLTSYTGVEINKEASQKAKIINKNAKIINGDFLEIDFETQFDLITSLSCIDWNIEFDAMLTKAWSLLKNNGTFVISLRLTEDKGTNNIEESYQYINYEGELSGEKAPYVVLNHKIWLNKIKELKHLGRVYAYGYYGKPSLTAVTCYEKICFAVFAISKLNKKGSSFSETKFNLNLPIYIQNM